jgi:tyrosinase
MRLFRAVATVHLLSAHLVAASPSDIPSTPVIDIDSTINPLEALAQLQQHTYVTLEQSENVSKRTSEGCSLATATVRRDW